MLGEVVDRMPPLPGGTGAVREPAQSRPLNFGVLILPGFGMLSYASVVDVLKQTRDYFSENCIRWAPLSLSDQPIAASNGLRVLPDAVCDEQKFYDYVIVIGVVGASSFADSRVLAWIRNQHRHGAMVCATGSATWLLAKSGLLRGRRCTLHWRDIDTFGEVYPDIEVLNEILVKEERLLTCSGARTASDMVYHILGEHFGSDVIERVQETLFHERLRGPHECQRPDQEHMQLFQPEFYRLLKAIDQDLEQQVTIGDLCNRLGLSQRRAERVFREFLKTTPKQYQLEQRLTRAANLLSSTVLSLAEIADATGFSSASSLSTSFTGRFGVPPLRYRKQSADQPKRTIVGKVRNRRIQRTTSD